MAIDFDTICKRLMLRAKIEDAKSQMAPADQEMIDLVLEILESAEPINVSEIAREYNGPFATIYGQLGHALVELREIIRKDWDWMEEHGFDPSCSSYHRNPVSRLVALS